jgi:glutamate 5-kinase
MSVYREIFAEERIPVAQLLITARDFRDRRAYLNIGHAIHELVSLNSLSIINENDTVSTEELQFGDNDLLSAACASLFHADLLVILTRVDGFLVDGERVPFLQGVGPHDMSKAGGPTGPGSGGMITKLRAAQLCSFSGEIAAILPGTEPNPVRALFEGSDIGTVVCGKKKKRLGARKRWLLYSLSRGSVHVDDGARRALVERGSSLLPSGIASASGQFLEGDVIEIIDSSGTPLGRGIAGYSQKELMPMLGMKASQIKDEGLAVRSKEVIHRNNMILEI